MTKRKNTNADTAEAATNEAVEAAVSAELMPEPDNKASEGRKASMKWLRGYFDGAVSDETMALLIILSEKMDQEEFDENLEKYHALLTKAKQTVKGIIYSVEPLDDDTVREFSRQTARLIGKDCVLVNQIDPKIMGGVLISVEDKLIDLSVRKKLEDLHVYIDDGLKGKGTGK